MSSAAAFCSFASYEPWTKIDMTFFVRKVRGLTVDENWYAPKAAHWSEMLGGVTPKNKAVFTTAAGLVPVFNSKSDNMLKW
jgi:hypothetical protein